MLLPLGGFSSATAGRTAAAAATAAVAAAASRYCLPSGASAFTSVGRPSACAGNAAPRDAHRTAWRGEAPAAAATAAGRSAGRAAPLAAPLAAAVLLGSRLGARRRRSSRRRLLALAATRQTTTLTKAERQEKKREEAAMLEAALLQLFEKEEPDIFKVRELLTRLARLTPRPNTAITGDWIIFWASREGCVDRVFGTGVTEENWWLEMQEFLLRLSTRKEGRVVEAAEVLRKVGPFPNQSNSLKGTYVTQGTNGLRLVFNDISSDEGLEVEVEGNKIKEKVVEVDVIYSSKGILAMQTMDDGGECDFFVLTPIRDLQREVNKLLGLERRRFFFN